VQPRSPPHVHGDDAGVFETLESWSGLVTSCEDDKENLLFDVMESSERTWREITRYDQNE
jgi:hypothetical protein